MAYNTILIRRRTSGAAGAPVALSGGELAFNEVDSTLYYGSGAGVISIAGAGAYVDRTTSQTIGGNKTFTGLTTLSSTTFSSGSVLNFGSNVLTNLAAPSANADATTKKYVDDAISSVGSTGNTAVNTLSTEVYNTFTKLTEERAVALNGGLTVANGINVDTITTTGNASVGGNLTITGDLAVLGATTTIETTTTVASAFAITNVGSGPALAVTQTGNADIATFYDDANTALIIKDGGNVGIGTATPSEKLTVSGSISATLDIFARNGDFKGTLDVDSAATLGSTLAVTGASTFASTISAQGAVEFDSTLSVDGSTTLNGAATINNTLNVTGAVDLDTTLNVDGNATYGGDITGNGSTSKLVDFIVDGGVF